MARDWGVDIAAGELERIMDMRDVYDKTRGTELTYRS